MGPISQINQLADILRKQLMESQAKSALSTKGPTETRGGAPSTRPSIDELQQKVREKLRHIDPNTPNTEKKSVHVFLESILLWEFGDRLMNDPKFYALLDEVQVSMETDPDVRKSLESLIKLLR